MISQFDRSDSTESLDQLLRSLSFDLLNPSEQRMHLIQQYYTLLNNTIRSKLSAEETKFRGSRRELRFYRLFSFELLDLALQFNVKLDRVLMNIQMYQQRDSPADPGMVRSTSLSDA